MFDFSGMEFNVSSMFAAYASLSASLMLIRTVFNDIIPGPARAYIESVLQYLFNRITPLSQFTTIVVEENSGISTNEIYEAAEIYLRSKVSPATERFKVHKTRRQNNISLGIEKDIEVTDEFRDFDLKWKFVVIEAQNNYSESKKFFELSFEKKHKQTVLDEYLPFVLDKSKEIKDGDKVVRLFTRDCPSYDDEEGSNEWGSINLEHPSTFDTLAMDPEMKKAVIEDLERFVRRKEYYKKVGKAWKRGYLLYGPPGTGKSSLVAAMANYLKFDIYDLELTSMYSNSELRRVLLSTKNRSIILVEDIDCSAQMKDREADTDQEDRSNSKLTLSGMLNFIDGLWSSCGDERIIIFTTNHKNKLDPALLRPGRMDLHIHMSYCTYNGFKVLASNYLDCQSHRLFAEIEDVIGKVTVTPAEIAEELMKSEDADVALEGVILFLKQKEVDQLELAKDDAEKKVKVEVEVEVKPNANGNISSADSEVEESIVKNKDKMKKSVLKLLLRKFSRKSRGTSESDQKEKEA